MDSIWFRRLILIILSAITIYFCGSILMTIFFLFKGDVSKLKIIYESLYTLGVPFILMFMFFLRFGKTESFK